MKLRNKSTGEIRKAEAREDGIYLWDELTGQWWKYGLEVIARYWEYYVEPKEPLIKDEKIRKAVRAWAEACELDTAQYYEYWQSFRCDDCVIGFKTEDTILNLDDGKWYTIAELCGEEE